MKLLPIVAFFAAVALTGSARPQVSESASEVILLTKVNKDQYDTLFAAGAKRAADDLGIYLKIETEIKQDPDFWKALISAEPRTALISLDTGEESFAEAVKAALAAGIPTVSSNAGGNIDFDADLYWKVGPDDRVLGQAVGSWMAKEGITEAVCFRGDSQIEIDRCNAYSQGFGAPVEIVELGPGINEVKQAIDNYVSSQSGSAGGKTGILAASDRWLEPAIETKDGLKAMDVSIASVESTGKALIGVADGSVAVSFDRRPFFEGYWAVAQLQRFFASGVAPSRTAFANPAMITNEDEALNGLASGNLTVRVKADGTTSGAASLIDPCAEENKPRWC